MYSVNALFSPRPVFGVHEVGHNYVILGDPGAVSRVDRMFVVKVFCKIEKTFTTNILSTRLTAPGSPRMQLRQCVVLLSVKNNVTKRGKKSHF